MWAQCGPSVRMGARGVLRPSEVLGPWLRAPCPAPHLFFLAAQEEAQSGQVDMGLRGTVQPCPNTPCCTLWRVLPASWDSMEEVSVLCRPGPAGGFRNRDHSWLA